MPKHHIRIESYGTVDELNSYIGLLRAGSNDAGATEVLAEIQDRLFTIGAHLASDPVKSRMKLPDIKEEDIQLLEQEMDRMNEILPPLKFFILPGGSQAVAFSHIARCVCRRAERLVVALSEKEEVEGVIIRYLNRLSDYLFVLGRKMAFDAGLPEIAWRPRESGKG